jgi:hypothetical protein
MNQILLSFGNKSRNGKDTAADGIKEWCKRHDFPVLHVNFADALKIEVTDAIRAAGGIEELLAEGPEPGVHFPSRVQSTPNADIEPLSPFGKHVKLLQWWGGDYRRSQDPKYWVDKRREKMVGFGGVVITSDTRYVNEAIDTLELGGYNVNVRRLNEDGSQYLDPSRPAGHLSEVELDPWNWDFRITVKPNEQKLVQMQAVQILKYRMKQEGWMK